jgi:starch phosphorylase
MGTKSKDYRDLDSSLLPIQPALGSNGLPVNVVIETRTGTIAARVWRLNVGRNMLLLLDSDVEGNQPEDCELTSRLYGGDERVRIRQELLLGVGGVRALAAMGIVPGVAHLNEGHSAFATLELARMRMASEGIHASEALRRTARQVVFTTHTPVPAGHDRFSPELVEEHLGPLRDAMGISRDEMLGLARVDPDNPHETFCMTVLALKVSRRANAVSSLHGQVSRAMWTPLYPERSEEQVPIGHITNGIHVRTWLAHQMHALYDRHLGADWPQRCAEPNCWDAIEGIDGGEIWETHQTLKTQLVQMARLRAARCAEQRGESAAFVAQMRDSLSLDALTIGFARRFATYKRANLILRDFERLAALINDAKRPVQFVFAGKAHPRDRPGKTCSGRSCNCCANLGLRARSSLSRTTTST